MLCRERVVVRLQGNLSRNLSKFAWFVCWLPGCDADSCCFIPKESEEKKRAVSSLFVHVLVCLAVGWSGNYPALVITVFQVAQFLMISGRGVRISNSHYVTMVVNGKEFL